MCVIGKETRCIQLSLGLKILIVQAYSLDYNEAMHQKLQNKQIALFFYTPYEPNQEHEAIRALERVLESPIDESVCFILADYEPPAALVEEKGKEDATSSVRRIIRLSPCKKASHEGLWELLSTEVLPILESLRGNTLHIDACAHHAPLHAVLLLLLYAGRLPHPTVLWYRQQTPSGKVRYSPIRLPLSSLDLRIQRELGTTNKAVYDRSRVRSEPLRQALDQLIMTARIPKLPILLLGEKGTGKTRLVESVYAAVKEKPVQTILCGSLVPELAMSTLFGHVKGAYTGADRDDRGLIGEAAGGIVFFDEIQDLPKPVQRMLVRFLQDPEHLYRPVGSSGRELKADVEIIFASHLAERELMACLDQDLFDRISLVTVTIPPLRDIRDDVPILLNNVWLEHKKFNDIEFPLDHPALRSWIQANAFAGNLRSLISLSLWYQICFIQSKDPEAALAEALRQVSTTDTSGHACPPEPNTPQPAQPLPVDNDSLPLKERVLRFKRSAVTKEMQKHGSYSAAARALSVDEKTIRNIYGSEDIPTETIYSEK